MVLHDLYTMEFGWLWMGFYGAMNDVRYMSDYGLRVLHSLPSSEYLYTDNWFRF